MQLHYLTVLNAPELVCGSISCFIKCICRYSMNVVDSSTYLPRSVCLDGCDELLPLLANLFFCQSIVLCLWQNIRWSPSAEISEKLGRCSQIRHCANKRELFCARLNLSLKLFLCFLCNFVVTVFYNKSEQCWMQIIQNDEFLIW